MLDIFLKIWGPPRKLFALSGVPSWLRTCATLLYISHLLSFLPAISYFEVLFKKYVGSPAIVNPLR